MTASLAVLVSGGGRSLENLSAVIDAGELDARIALVLANTPKAFALERAERLGLQHTVVPHADHTSPESFSRAVFSEIESRDCDLIVLAGFLRLLLLPERWLGRVLNIHPSLLPKYGGKGFYGDRVHRAVIEAAEIESGCTVHYVTNEYDRGPIVLQRRVPVLKGDTADELAARVFEAEKLALPEALRRYVAGDVAFTAPG